MDGANTGLFQPGRCFKEFWMLPAFFIENALGLLTKLCCSLLGIGGKDDSGSTSPLAI